MQSIIDQISQFSSLAFIGQCKNAGKTTALGHVLRGLWDDGKTLAITSIGRDGESVDRVTGTEKPGIFVRSGTLLATASGLLRQCDITREIVETTGMPTPLGQVVVVRALSDGYVDLAGPSTIDQLVALRRRFEALGARRVIVDGAISRKTLCSKRLSQASVLSVGASCGRDMTQVVLDAAHTCHMLGLPQLEDPQLANAMADHPEARALLISAEGTVTPVPSITDLTELVKAQESTRILYIAGALSQGLADSITRAGFMQAGVTLVVDDASKILMDGSAYHKLTLRGGLVRVLDSIRLAAVTVNPFSAYGYHFEPEAFLQAMSAAVTVPVYDLGRVDSP